MWDPDEVARMCYERYTALPRRGKPEEGREWTQLAAVIQVTRCPDTHTGGCTRRFLSGIIKRIQHKLEHVQGDTNTNKLYI